MLELKPNPILAGPLGMTPATFTLAGGVALAEREMNARPHIETDRRTPAMRHKAQVRDARQAKNAAEALGECS